MLSLTKTNWQKIEQVSEEKGEMEVVSVLFVFIVFMKFNLFCGNEEDKLLGKRIKYAKSSPMHNRRYCLRRLKWDVE